ncbi:MAG: carboxypeptidase regulatory-like domain-containing protein [candidate division Zixibacteria bacterium]|nr:carboxypeptidase regulatory-like domain-containing protein [candidate division Zixibacteria bacterium]
MGTIQGQVKDLMGRPIEGATIIITGDSPEHKDIAALTNENGEYSFDDLIGGAYSLMASTEDGIQKEQKVDVNTGEISHLDFVIEKL